jgi:hypothetical protein
MFLYQDLTSGSIPGRTRSLLKGRMYIFTNNKERTRTRSKEKGSALMNLPECRIEICILHTHVPGCDTFWNVQGNLRKKLFIDGYRPLARGTWTTKRSHTCVSAYISEHQFGS